MNKVVFGMMTVPPTFGLRGTNYTHSSVKSLVRSGFFESTEKPKLTFFSGAAESWHLDRYRAEPDKFLIEEMPAEILGALDARMQAQGMLVAYERGKSNYALLRRMALNDYRVLNSVAADPSVEGVVMLHDDVKFCNGWLPWLRDAVAEVEQAHGSRWIMSLCIFYRSASEALEAFRQGKKWIVFDRHLRERREYVGSTALLFPRSIALEFGEYVRKNALDVWRNPTEVLIGRFMAERGVASLATAPSLVQHVGISSSWCGATTGAASGSFEYSVLPDGGAVHPIAAFVRQAVPTSMRKGTQSWVTIEMRNIGEDDWPGNSLYLLGAVGPHKLWGTIRAPVPVGAVVEPGATAVFAFKVTAPSKPGSYPFQWRMVEEGRCWFGETSPLVNVEVQD